MPTIKGANGDWEISIDKNIKGGTRDNINIRFTPKHDPKGAKT